MKKFCVAAVLAALLSIGIVGGASAHSAQPANRCSIAFLTWQANPTPGNAAAASACIQSHTVGGSTPFNFNTSNFGFNNGFGFNPQLGFNPGFGGFIPFDGFGQTVAECPPGTFAQEQLTGTVEHPVWVCAQGLGNRFPGACPSGLNLIETGFQNSPIWSCQL